MAVYDEGKSHAQKLHYSGFFFSKFVNWRGEKNQGFESFLRKDINRDDLLSGASRFLVGGFTCFSPPQVCATSTRAPPHRRTAANPPLQVTCPSGVT